MIYCRWSSDNYQCDLYCYSDATGVITTHVAPSRLVKTPPPIPDIHVMNINQYLNAYEKHNEFMRTTKKVPIGLPHDGQKFDDNGEVTFIQTLAYLKVIGYRFPANLIPMLQANIAQPKLEPIITY